MEMAQSLKRLGVVAFAAMLCLLLAVAFAGISSTKAYADSIPASKGGKALGIWKQGKTYKTFDVTGDKRADKVKYTYKNGKFTLYVNKKAVYSKKCVGYTSPILVKLKNGKTFIQIDVVKNSGKSIAAGLFQYKSGKLVQKLNYLKVFKKKGYIFAGTGISEVSGNTIYLYSNGFKASGTKYCFANAAYTYKGNAFKAASKTTYF